MKLKILIDDREYSFSITGLVERGDFIFVASDYGVRPKLRKARPAEFGTRRADYIGVLVRKEKR